MTICIHVPEFLIHAAKCISVGVFGAGILRLLILAWDLAVAQRVEKVQ